MKTSGGRIFVGGEPEFLVDVDGERHFTRLLAWLPGRPLFGAPPSEPQMRAVGEALGRLARGLADFDHPASDHRIVWDMRHAPDLLPLTRDREVYETSMDRRTEHC